ncbi:MAG TPA: CbtA family protein [Stellaceae bacterium]|nr:CbtA family protein [Stellaceae bacterium]
MARILATALMAGCIAGLFFFAVQSAKLTPLILAAEVYEDAAAHGHGAAGHDHDAAAWQPAPGLERIAYTALADVIIGCGFALVLVSAFAFRGVAVDAGQGLLWGIAGYVVFALAPALGLPPELPGSLSAELLARQTWWVGTAAATASGLALIAFARRPAWKAVGAAIMVFPHVIGAPHPHEIGGAVPPELAAEFTAASLATTALFWCALGLLSGGLYGGQWGRGALQR